MGLRTKLLLPLLLSGILLVSYLYGFWIPRLLADAENAYQSGLERHLDSIAENLVPLILGRQLDTIYNDLDALLKKNDDWVSIRLFDVKGNLLYPLDDFRPPSGEETHDIRILKQAVRSLGTDLGYLLVKADFTPPLEGIRNKYMHLLYSFLAVVPLILLMTGLILERLAGGPIRLLADASERLAEKDYETPLPVTGKSEIGRLVSSFAKMRDAIRSHAKELSEANEELRREIAERWRAGQEQQKFVALIENSSDFIGIVSLDGRLVYLNRAGRTLVGLDSADEATSKMIFDFFFEEDWPELETSMLPTGSWRGEFRMRHFKTNRAIPVELSGFLIRDANTGRPMAHAAITRDITERKQAEEKVRKLNENLELKVEEKTAQLIAAQEELIHKEKLAALGQLSGSIGHELRNPLGVINNAVFYLEKTMPEADHVVKEYLEIIKSEIDHSQRIITDVLDLTHIKKAQKKSVAVSEVIDRGLARCLLPANVNVCVDAPNVLPPVEVDLIQMGQVMQNLITNAVQAMTEGGKLTIKTRLTRDEGRGTHSSVEISVADTGSGIAPDNMKNLFQPLFTTKARGIGLGLVVAKRLIEANGGKITADSELGKNTTFTVILPVEAT